AWLLPAAATYTPAGAGWRDTYMYALTQPAVILHYLRLSLWPTGLTLEESWPLVSGFWPAFPAIVLLGGIACGLIAAGRRQPAVLGIALWGALALAPTSSLVPLRDPAVEHRM